MPWQVDTARSRIGFTVPSFNFMTVEGTFERWHGTFDMNANTLAEAWVDVEIEAQSIVTGNLKRDAHMRSADFLNVMQFPTLRFRSTQIEAKSRLGGLLTGNLTIRDVTRPVTLIVEAAGLQTADTVRYMATTTLDRRQWGITWNDVPGMVGNRIDVNLLLVAVRQPEPNMLSVQPVNS